MQILLLSTSTILQFYTFSYYRPLWLVNIFCLNFLKLSYIFFMPVADKINIKTCSKLRFVYKVVIEL